MMIKIAVMITIIMYLTSCGGTTSEDQSRNVEIPNLRISTFDVIGHEMEVDFDPEKTGTYEIDVDSSVESVNISLTVSSDAQEGDVSYLLRSSGQNYRKDISDSLEFNIELDEGTNLLSVSLINDDALSFVTYQFSIYRVYSTARLNGLSLFEFPSDLSTSIRLSPSFSPQVYNYQATVPYSSCAAAAVPFTNTPSTTVSHANQSTLSGEPVYKNLEVGRNYMDIILHSEDGKREEKYSIEVLRSEGTQENNTNIKSLKVSEGDIEFVCGIYGYSTWINSNVSEVNIELETEVDGAQVSVNGNLIDPEEPIPISIENSDRLISILVTSGNGSQSRLYQIELKRRSNNYFHVETVEELSQAIKNARPNDFIELAEGDYDLNDLPSSELSNGTLITDRSGTQLEPIILTVSPEAEVNFYGTEQSNSSILAFTGKHWRIGNIHLSKSDYGISLLGAENILLSNITFNELNIGGVVEQAGKNNIVSFSRFEDIGLSNQSSNMIEILDNSDHFGSRQNSFTIDTHNTAILFSDNSTNVVIESNIFSHNEALTELNHALIQGGGDNAHIRYNLFDFKLKGYNESLINMSSNAIENAIGTYIYENRIKDIDTEVSYIHSDYSPTYIQLPEHTPDMAVISGSNIVNSWVPPSYKIELKSNSQFCLGLYRNPDIEEDLDFVAIDVCDDNEEQEWRIEVGDTAPYVKIKNTSVDDDKAYLSTIANFFQLCGIATVYLTEEYTAFGQRWLLDKISDDIYIRSKSIRDYGLTGPASNHNVDDPLTVCAVNFSEAQSFNLIPIE